MTNPGKEAALFLFGAAVGATILALTTPSKGEELRVKLRQSFHKTKHEALDAAENIEDNLREARDTTRDRLASSKLLEEGLNTLT